jgi:hypothetical protein
MLLRHILRLSSPLFLLVYSLSVQGQINSAYSIGSIGMSGQTSVVFSGPVLIDAEQCFFLSNGVKVMSAPGKGPYNSTCFIVTDLFSIELTGYPNPVVTDILVRAVDKVKVMLNSELRVKLFDGNGRVVSTKVVDTNMLNSGFYLSMRNLTTGTYTMQLVSGNTPIGHLKIIKIN